MNEDSIFRTARKFADESAREKYLIRVCGDDLEALKRIRAKLAAATSESSLLLSPICDADSTKNPVFSVSYVGKRIGSYKILQEIGAGGMGTVFMAEQEDPVRRRVALKIIKAKKLDKRLVARFEAERQALALMDHPNIAKVLDAGEDVDGSPYLVMELVQGIPITKYCDQYKLAPINRLQLFVDVCKAVQHAHQKGILHRDLKPANVLVCIKDGKPVPKVIDFGLAKPLHHQIKLTDKTMFTEFGQVIGTIQYMSPEQAALDALDIDTRSDIYSLGIMLFELLAGSTPLEKETVRKKAFLKVLELIREEDPPRPSIRLASSKERMSKVSEMRQIQPFKLAKLLREELDWVVMKALEKDRTRRYESAYDLAEDISRHLDGQAVLAAPPSRTYLLKKFMLRNKTQVVVVASLFASLVLGTIGTSIGFAWAVYERGEAKSAVERLQAMNRDLRARSLIGPFSIGYANWYDEDSVVRGRLGDGQRIRNKFVFSTSVIFSEPAHFYVFHIDPDGSTKLIYPADESTKPEENKLHDGNTELVVIPHSRARVYENTGLHLVAVVASFDPLPSFSEWKKEVSFPYNKNRDNGLPSTTVWRFNGSGYEPDSDPPEGFRLVCEQLAGEESVDAFKCIGFWVWEDE